MTWLYRLQNTVALTATEIRTLASLVLLFAGGQVVRAVQRHDAPPLNPRLLIQEARAFQARSAAAEAALAPRVDSVRAVAQEDAARFAVELRAARAIEARQAPTPSSETRKKTAAPIPRMNLNTATGAQLELLPRVGPALAGRILAYRAANGGFRRPADLTNVKGIGEKTLEKLLPYVYVE